jgi:iron complex outermembrane receptor protein
MKINFLLITLYCFSFKGIAQVDPIRQNPIPQDSVANTQILTTVVLSASYQKASGVLIPTEKITESVLQNFTPIDLVDAINQTSGVYIQSGAINTNRITIRGVGSRTLFGTNKIRAYFNGIPITSGAGETNIDSYDTNSLSTIEIVKGPKATQYGSNLGGTILLSTKEANKDGLDVSTTFSAGSYGLFKNTTSASYK